MVPLFSRGATDGRGPAGARTLASAVPAGVWTSLWIYVAAPVVGMLAAVQLYARHHRPVHCAKLYHPRGVRCIFRCDYAALKER